jgi:VWFA-related protein
LIWINARGVIYAAPYALLRQVTVVHDHDWRTDLRESAMPTTNATKKPLTYLAAFALLAGPLAARERAVESTKGDQASKGSEADVRIHVPNRPSTSLFKGKQGKQKAEIVFDPDTHIVTVKLLVQDPRGYFIPNIRRDNFAIFENGVRQKNASVDVQHAAVSVGLLLEYGGRYQALNETLGTAVSTAADQFLNEIGKDDKIAIWRYGDSVQQLADFSQAHDTLRDVLISLPPPSFSELNLYDALIDTLTRMQGADGREALVLIGCGLDTFSKANFGDALRAVRRAGIPVYAINLGHTVSEVAADSSGMTPYGRINWKRAERELEQFANESGGRMYSPQSIYNLPGIYDDLMENLRVRYVITYRSAGHGDMRGASTVRIELIDPTTGGPLEIVDANGMPVRWTVTVKGSYVPRAAAER